MTATITGQVIKIRKLSSRIAFADVTTLSNNETIEIIFKQNYIVIPSHHPFSSTTASSIKSVLKLCKLGSILNFNGEFESPTNRDHRVFKCCALPVLEKEWKGDRPFQPEFVYCQPIAREPVPAQQIVAGVDTNTAITTSAVTLMDDQQYHQLCKFYTSNRTCPRSPNCPYLHTQDANLRNEYFTKKKQLAIAAERNVVGGETTFHDDDTNNATSTKSKSHRFIAFAEFIIQKFHLTSQSLVLDVAGGRGDLCFELSALRNIPCTSVDPRGRKLNKKQHRYLKERTRNEHDNKRSNTTTNEITNGNDHVNGSNHSREEFEKGDNYTIVAEEKKEEPLSPWGQHLSCLFHSNFFDNEQSKMDLLPKISLIVGLHPDEATEHIIDCCLAKGIPFAVAPCCVFQLEGKRMSFRDWCDYLQSKHGDIRREYMDCGGKNLVLTWKRGEEGEEKSVDNNK